MPEFITAYGPKIKVELVCLDPSRTKQSMKDEADINFIMQKYQRTGLVNHLEQQQGEYGDFAAIDFQEAMQTIKRAEEMFESVPSSVRKQFNNDPGEFLRFVTDDANKKAMVDLGLAYPDIIEPAPFDPPPPADPTPEG